MGKRELDKFLKLRLAHPCCGMPTDAAKLSAEREAAYRTHLATRPGGNEWPVDAAWRELADRVATEVTVCVALGCERVDAIKLAPFGHGATRGYAVSCFRGVCEAPLTPELDPAAYRLGVAYREWARGGGSHG